MLSTFLGRKKEWRQAASCFLRGFLVGSRFMEHLFLLYASSLTKDVNPNPKCSILGTNGTLIQPFHVGLTLEFDSHFTLLKSATLFTPFLKNLNYKIRVSVLKKKYRAWYHVACSIFKYVHLIIITAKNKDFFFATVSCTQENTR